MSNLSESPEGNPRRRIGTSPFWKERPKKELGEQERKELEGILEIERLAERIGSDHTVNFNLENLALDFYQLAFSPFGHGIRGYRETNILVTGSPFEYPHYREVGKLMNRLGKEVNMEVAKAEDCCDISKVIQAAGKIHEMVYIHPFTDGNGRVTRAMINFLFWRVGLIPPDWRYQGRDTYLDAAENTAVKGDPRIFQRFLAGALISSFSHQEERIREQESPVTMERLEYIIGRRRATERFLASL